jgi:hypothetical protein
VSEAIFQTGSDFLELFEHELLSGQKPRPRLSSTNCNTHKKSPHQADLLAEQYFGFRNANGVAGERFLVSIEAIYNQTDDCIFFSRILADDLLTYGNGLRRKNAWKYSLGVPKLKGADWVKSDKDGLLPSKDSYSSWLGGFDKAPTHWQRLRSHLLRSK